MRSKPLKDPLPDDLASLVLHKKSTGGNIQMNSWNEDILDALSRHSVMHDLDPSVARKVRAFALAYADYRLGVLQNDSRPITKDDIQSQKNRIEGFTGTQWTGRALTSIAIQSVETCFMSAIGRVRN